MQTNLCQMLQNIQEISYCLLCNIMSDNFGCVVCRVLVAIIKVSSQKVISTSQYAVKMHTNQAM